MDFSKLPNLKKLPNQDEILANASETIITKPKQETVTDILKEMDEYMARLSKSTNKKPKK